MQTISYTDARNQLAGLMNTASRDREPIIITRNGAGKVVLLAIEEYEAMETTLHLHSTGVNATQIQQSLDDYEAGKILKRVNELVKDAQRNPFTGIGKPEPMKNNLKGWWSRRITQEHRFIDKVENESLLIMQCRFHYDGHVC